MVQWARAFRRGRRQRVSANGGSHWIPVIVELEVIDRHLPSIVQKDSERKGRGQNQFRPARRPVAASVLHEKGTKARMEFICEKGGLGSHVSGEIVGIRILPERTDHELQCDPEDGGRKKTRWPEEPTRGVFSKPDPNNKYQGELPERTDHELQCDPEDGGRKKTRWPEEPTRDVFSKPDPNNKYLVSYSGKEPQTLAGVNVAWPPGSISIRFCGPASGERMLPDK
ncbi:hypothetical protein C8R43DRAFT_943786 [Mycena crocata]|nr:hypothetical protein C8R43DRAFT_943786 [Mycena crocata]